jgi:hypothetical protein
LAHSFLCFFQSNFWHCPEQYATALQRAQVLDAATEQPGALQTAAAGIVDAGSRSVMRVQCGIRESAGDGFGGESVNFWH